MQSRIGRAAIVAASMWSVVGLSSAPVEAQTYTVHVSIDPASRRHYVFPDGTPEDIFECSYAPVTFDLTSYTDLAFDFTVAGGGFLASTTPGESVSFTLDDSTGTTCGYVPDSSTDRMDLTDVVWKGTDVPATSLARSWFASSPAGSSTLSVDSAAASGVFEFTGATYTRPSTTGSTQTHQVCRCEVFFWANRGDDVSLVWGPDVPRTVGATVVTTEAASATQCPNGGVVVREGHDDGFAGGVPGDGIVDVHEAEQTQLVCSGSDLSSLVSTGPAGSSCAHGGTRIDTGLDDGADGGVASDGILEPGEVQKTAFVCNGASGCSAARAPSSRGDFVGLTGVLLFAAMVGLRRRRARRVAR